MGFEMEEEDVEYYNNEIKQHVFDMDEEEEDLE
ncbi:hypothetical protein LCGC14_1519180 [marine sediment metagenome]|uniref:Uncharacterized protein n=1 Tax=marine sediment metagenome TaxID=412755 RepID=A0A0F9LER3_9ZZZZ